MDERERESEREGCESEMVGGVFYVGLRRGWYFEGVVFLRGWGGVG